MAHDWAGITVAIDIGSADGRPLHIRILQPGIDIDGTRLPELEIPSDQHASVEVPVEVGIGVLGPMGPIVRIEVRELIAKPIIVFHVAIPEPERSACTENVQSFGSFTSMLPVSIGETLCQMR